MAEELFNLDEDEKLLSEYREALIDGKHEAILRVFRERRGEAYEDIKKHNEGLRQKGYSYKDIAEINLKQFADHLALSSILEDSLLEYVKAFSPEKKAERERDFARRLIKSGKALKTPYLKLVQ